MKAISKFLIHIEKEFNCAGICQPPLFYYSKNVNNGPPKEACVVLMVNDIAPGLSKLGGVLTVSGVLILLMNFCAIPICCYKREVGIFEDEDEDNYIENKDDQNQTAGNTVN